MSSSDVENPPLTEYEAKRMVALHLRPEFPLLYVGDAVLMEEEPPIWEVYFRVNEVDFTARVSGFTPEETQIVDEV